MTKVSFDGVVLNDKFLVGNIKRPMPEFRSTSTTVEGRDGDEFDSITVGTRRCSFTVVAARKTEKALQDAARTLAAILSVRKPVKLTFSDERDKDGNQLVRYAVPDGAFDADSFKSLGKWDCEFVMHDPYLYGKSRSVVLKANQAQKIQAGGGDNIGMFPVAVSNPRGTTYTLGIKDGQGVTIKAPFAGEELRVDFARERITINPAIANAEGIQTRSRFFSLSGTMNLISNNQTTLTWTERWL